MGDALIGDKYMTHRDSGSRNLRTRRSRLAGEGGYICSARAIAIARVIQLILKRESLSRSVNIDHKLNWDPLVSINDINRRG